MQRQTTIEQFYKSRKRPAVDELQGHHSKLTARKLFYEGEDKLCDYDNDTTATNAPKDSDGRKTPVQSPSILNTTSKKSGDELYDTATNAQKDSDGRKTPIQSPNTLNMLKQELGLGEFKKVIRNSKRIDSLKLSLQRYKTNKTRLAGIEEKIRKLDGQELQYFNSVHIEIPASPKKFNSPLKPHRLFSSPNPSPQKSDTYVSPRKLLNEGPSKKTPVKSCAEKYNHLLATGKDALILPYKYSMLKEVFRAVDTIIKILIERGETVTFSKLKLDVQKMIGRNFLLSHLGQIKAVDPNTYEYSQEKVRAPFSKNEQYELVIRPIMRNGEICGIKSNGSALSLLERQRCFHKKLLEHTKNLHRDFMRSLDPPILVENDQIRRWHPEFDLDNVPDIVPSSLPEPPISDKVTSVKDFLDKARNMINCNKKMAQALNATAISQVSNSASEETSQNTNGTSSIVISKPSPVPAFQKALKGIPKSLLEKIRAKEAAKIAETMVQSAEKVREDVMMSRLPELARIMRNVFVTEKKGVLPQDIVLLKINHSYREKLSTVQLIQHLELISKHVPGWMNFCNVRNTAYIRLSKDADMSRITGKLKKLAGKS